MIKNALKKYHNTFSKNEYIIKFSKMVSAENLWHFHRESVAKACALGVACGWIPLPMHTLIAVAIAVLIDCNIPLTAVAIWVANPITMPFMYYYAYKLGAMILNIDMVNIHFHLTMHDILKVLHLIWEPFLLGCLICGVLSGLVTYLLAHLLWPSNKDRLDV